MKKLTNPMLIALYKSYQIDYECLKNATDMKNRIRTQSNRIYKKEFGNKDWDSLTLNEKNYFILHCMKDYMFKEIEEVIHPRNSIKVRDIRTTIESLIKEQYVSVNEHIKQSNVNIEKLYTKDQNGHSTYGDLQDELLELYKDTDDSMSTSDDIRFSILETKIDVLLKVVKEKLNIQIDSNAIEECCKYLIKHDFTIDEVVQLEIDEQSSVPLEVQKQFIQSNQKYFAYMIQKENLEFYKDRE